MLDLKFVRENPEIVKQNIKNKFQDQKLPLVDEVIALDAERRAAQQAAVFQDLEEKMKAALGTKVSINRKNDQKGKIEIEYYSMDELERLMEILMK